MNAPSFHCHGGMPELDMERLGLAQRTIVDFSVNLSPLGPPVEITQMWNGLAAEIERYPSMEGDGVASYYCERLGLELESVLAGNGSTELIYLIPRVLGFRSVAVVTPGFHDYSRACQLAGAGTSSLTLAPEEDFAFPGQDRMREAAARAEALFIGNPNNPTGTVFPAEFLLQFADDHPDKWLLVDEAFVNFVDPWREVTLAAPDRLRPNVLVLQSLTKFYALPGLRLGCVIGLPEVISRLRACKEPWSVNRVAEQVARRLIDCRAYDERLRELIRGERARVCSRVRSIPGVRAFEPSANFILAQWTATDDLDDLLRALLADGLYVRDCRNFVSLERNYFRFAVRAAEDNDRLLEAVERIAHSHGARVPVRSPHGIAP